MTIAASTIVQRVYDVIQDTTSVRWPTTEVVRWLNDGQREIVLHRPDSMATNATVACVAGTKQSIPAGGTKLIDVIRNTAGNKRAIRNVEREVLDAQISGWHNLTGVAEILHFVFDERDPRTFYVYPPSGTAGTQASVEVVYSAMPTDIAAPTGDYSTVVGNLSVPDIFANALLDFILYRAYTKDSDYAGNAQRAQAHYAAFANSLGIEIKATLDFSPNQNSPLNPNFPKSATKGGPRA